MVSKCGTRVIHHWAHAQKKSCDPWWENETAWHRKWKNEFPSEWREVVHFAEDGEKHIADVKTSKGITIEFQHSPMTDLERISREEFYRNLVWVIDGSFFKDRFFIYHMLPRPDSELASDLVWVKAKHGLDGANRGLFFRLSEARLDDPATEKSNLQGGWYHSIQEIEKEIEKSYNGYHQFDWVRPKKTWLDSKFPVYLDLGDEYLLKFATYDESGLKCIRLVSKKSLFSMRRMRVPQN
jgi:competence protein CoiA